MTLQQELSELKTDILNRLPRELTDKFDQAIKDLDASGIVSSAPKVGEKIKGFDLPNQSGQQRSLTELRAFGPVVVVFYRGGWCPYCNLELHAYQQILPKLKAAGAQLIAISPELPDNSLSTIEKNDLEFEVLSDVGASYANEIGLAYSLPVELRKIYAELGGDLEKYNGDGHFDLPIPATLVVDEDGEIAFAHVDPDYTSRADPNEVLSIVESINSAATSH